MRPPIRRPVAAFPKEATVTICYAILARIDYLQEGIDLFDDPDNAYTIRSEQSIAELYAALAALDFSAHTFPEHSKYVARLERAKADLRGEGWSVVVGH